MPATRFSAPGPARLKPCRAGPKAGSLAALLLATACLLLPLAGAAQAATSETCLRRCLGVCADKGQAGSEACLRPCLQDCPVYCGTVDADCALACVAKAGEAGGEATAGAAGARAADPRTAEKPADTAGEQAAGRAGLAARCSGACTVMADCRPSTYDNGPADLFPATPPPHAKKLPQ